MTDSQYEIADAILKSLSDGHMLLVLLALLVWLGAKTVDQAGAR